ncbi:MBL fold metallo-hydrolase [Clostridium estertheticum]|uniref:ComEC/Rec2 family competence protein n=1 Tax=Clostridium estertheticum TaxID=238834 RepID=UPI001CF5C51B|nr:ComEC/Rec2 family competence protein [Clostridium estertheticum]MCB2305969.1 MBL fold metallo-hydrolase [Clostridium estertheticum]MCB2345562.1 MBL fold metallo-hydrolase [Clostridium estertheticum]MCB2349059.1 MBL fold metallo-hydrolase [Clostridium estertheticum]WAG47697.1 MBL fold metallo-hydrolase [Clostridium estertheticum]
MPKKTWLKYALICVSLIFVIVCTTISYKSTIKTSLDLENNMVTHFIDVGQGDCTLIQVNNKNLLIDSGTSDSKQKLIRYLKKNNITKLDYIVATHPHEDHIGGTASVIKNFEIGEFYAPKAITSTQTFNDMIDALRSKNLKIKIATPNISLNLGPNATCFMLSPNKTTYDNLNNYSCTLKISYKNSTYLFTGDIETQAEQELIANGYDLSAQVLKVAHHGSKTSSSKEFLAKVSPKIAVISCGIDNDYGHPNRETLDRLKRLNTIVYRTDLDKTIVLISDGTKIKKLDN